MHDLKQIRLMKRRGETTMIGLNLEDLSRLVTGNRIQKDKAFCSLKMVLKREKIGFEVNEYDFRVCAPYPFQSLKGCGAYPVIAHQRIADSNKG